MGIKALQTTTCGTSLVISGATTTYTYIANSYLTANATIARRQLPYRTAGSLSNLRAVCTGNTVDGDSVLTVNIGGVDGSGTVTIPNSTTGIYEDLTNTDSVSVSNLVCLKAAVGGSSGSLTLYAISTIFTATTDSCAKHCTYSTYSMGTASTAYYGSISGRVGQMLLTEYAYPFMCRTAGTIRNGAVYAQTNARSTASTFVDRIAGGSGTISISITALTTGLFQDTTHSDSVTSGQKINVMVTTGTGTGSLVLEFMTVEFVTTNGNFLNIYCTFDTLSPASTNYHGIGGGGLASTESDIKQQIGIDVRCTNLFCAVYIYSLDASPTITLRSNGADGNNTISLTGTGDFEDTTHYDIAPAGYLLNFKSAIGGSTGSATIGVIGFMAAPTILPFLAMTRNV